jgi:hypothetical protein
VSRWASRYLSYLRLFTKVPAVRGRHEQAGAEEEEVTRETTMSDEVRVNGKANVLQVIQLLAQFLLLPLLWLIYQIYIDQGIMRLQIARMEGRIESHQVSSDMAIRVAAEKVALEAELAQLRAIIERHREKSTYDRK